MPYDFKTKTTKLQYAFRGRLWLYRTIGFYLGFLGDVVASVIDCISFYIPDKVWHIWIDTV